MGGCGWSRCPRNRILSHVAKDMASSWFAAVGSQSAQNLELLGAFLGLFLDISWSQRATKSSLTQGFFGPKMAVFGPKLQFLKLRSATCKSRSRPPPSSFLLKLCVIVLHTHRYHPPKFHPNLKHHDGVLIFTHFARAAACLLACLLAAAKPGRSTVDTKKGYKTKTGSTSSVTLTLTRALRLLRNTRVGTIHCIILAT